jgi:effector-binding domain-containing protein
MTSTEPELVSARPVITAVVRGVVPVAELRGFFDASFRALAEVIAGQQVGVLGPAFALFRGPVGGTADLEVGFPVERAPRPEGDVRASALPGGRVARMTHRGSFGGLGASWDRLQRWLREQGLSPSAQRWESYVTEPTPHLDPRDLRTELHWRVEEQVDRDVMRPTRRVDLAATSPW